MPAADLVFLGATVEPITARQGPPPGCVAVSAGRIAAVGQAADVEPLIGPSTRVVRMNGETLLPGFQDAHIHPP